MHKSFNRIEIIKRTLSSLNPLIPVFDVISDKIDMGALMLETVPEDIESLKPILSQGQFETPEIKMSIYKNRRNKYKGILLWCKADRGTCKIIPMFATNYNYEMIPIDDVRITVEEEKSAF